MARERDDKWALYVGIGLVALGVWLLIERVAGPVFEPIRATLRFIQNLGWPLALILLGALLIVGFPRLKATELKGRRLYRSRKDKMVAGVLAGVASFVGADPTWVRLAYVLFAVVVGVWPAAVLYIIAAVIVPKEPEISGTVEGTWKPSGDGEA